MSGRRFPQIFLGRTCLALACLTAAAAVASAAEPLGGPVAGYVFDRGIKGIRPINGIPGSAMLGDALALPVDLDSAVFTGAAGFALARSSGPDRKLWVVQRLGSGQPVFTPVAGGSADAEMAMNARGSAAVLYSASGVQFIAGLPDQPTAGAVIGLPDLDGQYTAAAVSGDGKWALLTVTGAAGGVYLVSNSPGADSPRRMASLASPSSVVLLNGDQDAIVADRTGDKVYLLRDVRGAADLIPIAGARTPVAVQVIRNEQTLLVVNAGDNSVAVIDLATSNIVQSVPLAGSPTRCSPLGGDVYLLNEPGDPPLLLLDAAAPQYRSVFVPAPSIY